MSPLPAAVDAHTHSSRHVPIDTHPPTQEASHTFILTASAIRQAHAHIWREGRPHFPGLQPISVLTDKDVLPSDARSGFHWRKRCSGGAPSKYKLVCSRGTHVGLLPDKNLKIATVWRCRQTLHRFKPEKCALHKETPAAFASILSLAIPYLRKWTREQVY